MADARFAPVLVAGAGVAGLTAALAFTQRGFAVRIFERAERLEEAGAGLQLSPNATRLLARLGVLDRLLPLSVAPERVLLRDAATLRELARVPLGAAAGKRWGAPYLTIHRADLQRALLEKVSEDGQIALFMRAEVRGVSFASGSVAATIERSTGGAASTTTEEHGSLLIGADGVWSAVRSSLGWGESRFSGLIAWRAAIESRGADDLIPPNAVSAFLHPKIHLVAYPLRGGAAVNLVAVMKGGKMAEGLSSTADAAPLLEALRGAEPRLRALVERAGPWSAWLLHKARPKRWIDPRGAALIGDAAHAMTPFAAQGAAMAIEDALALADHVAAAPDDLSGALVRYEGVRRPRIASVARRGALNHLAWHASGPVALVRNATLRLRPPERLAADLDWLYGYDAEAGASLRPVSAGSG